MGFGGVSYLPEGSQKNLYRECGGTNTVAIALACGI